MASEGEQTGIIQRYLYVEPDPNGNRKARRAHKRKHGGFKDDTCAHLRGEDCIESCVGKLGCVGKYQPSEVDSE